MTDRKTDKPDIVFFPPLLFLVATILTVGLEWVVPLALLPDGLSLVSVILGVPLLLTTAWLEFAANRQFRSAGTNVDPRRPALKVVRSGPYRFTRNPMYLGLVLSQLGLAFTFSLDWGLPVGAVLWAALNFGVVLREEAYLKSKFGADYEALLKSTRRWL